jgi:alpha-ketoglutaric semialdehyde dehydrogenase
LNVQPSNFIAGEYAPASSNEAFSRRNPADEREEVGVYPRSTPEDVGAAVEAADKATRQWGLVPGPRRATVLHRVASILEAEIDDAARELTCEEGKTLAEARGEVTRSVNIFRFFAEQARSVGGETADSEEPGTMIFTRRRPMGVVGLITPWNFPIAIPAWKAAPALAFGNTVVLKPASLAPAPALRLADALTRAELPPGAFNVVIGEGSAVGDALVGHPKISAISFTGSTGVGQEIRSRLASAGTRFQAEMGGHNPVIVLRGADLDTAARIVADGAFLSAGQKCTATRRAIVEAPVYYEFTKRLAAVASEMRVGNGLDPSVTVSPLVGTKQRDEVVAEVDRAREEGAELLVGGRGPKGELAHGAFLEPTVLTEVDPGMKIAQEEVFGPVCAVLRASSVEDAIALANGVRYGLSAAVITRDIAEAFHFIEGIDAGMVHVNRQTAGVDPHMPLGGMKASGSHFREQGRAAREFYAEEQTVYLRGLE